MKREGKKGKRRRDQSVLGKERTLRADGVSGCVYGVVQVQNKRGAVMPGFRPCPNAPVVPESCPAAALPQPCVVFVCKGAGGSIAVRGGRVYLVRMA